MVDGELPESCRTGECVTAVAALEAAAAALLRLCNRIASLRATIATLAIIEAQLAVAAALLFALTVVLLVASFFIPAIGTIYVAVLIAAVIAFILAVITHALRKYFEQRLFNATMRRRTLRANFAALVQGVRDNCPEDCIECLDLTTPC